MEKKRSIIGLIPLINLMASHGKDAMPVLNKHHIDLDNMMGSAVIDQAVELEIIEDILGQLDQPLPGIEVGSQISFTSYGTFALLLMTAPTLMEACRLSIQFQSLSLLYSQTTLHMDKDWIEVRFIQPNCKPEIKSFIADRDLMGSYVFINEILSEPQKHLLGCGTCRPKPQGEQLKTYRKHIVLDPQFDQAYDWFRFPYSVASAPLAHANPLVHKIYLMQAYEMLRALSPEQDNVVSQVKRILSGYDSQFPGLLDIAKTLGHSERTLRRRLKEAGESYRDILDAHKKKRALDMLALKDINIDTLTQALGYTEPASFLRAFKRWTGLTPKQYSKGARDN